MRLLVTADLHYNHGKGRGAADELIGRMNAVGGDVLLVVGDVAAADGDALERCLGSFRFGGPKLFAAGNHELWTSGPDSLELYREQLPRRVAALGWHWLDGAPFDAGEVAFAGNVGWYDYSFASPSLDIPRRFYERKVSPGAARRLPRYQPLFEAADDLSPASLAVVARWNDGRFVKLHRPDEDFLRELLDRLEVHLAALGPAKRVVAAVHHVPFAELLPPHPLGGQRDFARAYLGSGRIGELLRRFPNVGHVFCGHSHSPAEARFGPLRAINIGSGYRWKTFCALEL